MIGGEYPSSSTLLIFNGLQTGTHELAQLWLTRTRRIVVNNEFQANVALKISKWLVEARTKMGVSFEEASRMEHRLPAVSVEFAGAKGDVSVAAMLRPSYDDDDVGTTVERSLA